MSRVNKLIRQEMSQLRLDLTGEIDGVKSEVKGIKQELAELKSELKEFREQNTKEHDSINKNIDALKFIYAEHAMELAKIKRSIS